jgi:hypothetical protein
MKKGMLTGSAAKTGQLVKFRNRDFLPPPQSSNEWSISVLSMYSSAAGGERRVFRIPSPVPF